MKTDRRWLIGILGLVILSGMAASVCDAQAPYRFVKEIRIGGDGGWDYLSVDVASRRLYVSHATKIVVIDLERETVLGEIADTPGVHGLAIAPELGRGFSSNGRENKVSIIDLKTLRTLSKVDTGGNPDAIVYEPSRQEVYAFNGYGNSATVIDAKTGRVVTTIALPGKPEFAVADSVVGRVYCNIEDKNVVVAIDTRTHRVVNTWPVAPGEEGTGLALDAAWHRLFVGCHNKLMVMMDSTNGKVIASVSIGQGVDATMFDPATRLAFASNGDGTVTVAHEDTPNKLTVVQTLATERGARTMTLDPKTHKIYLSSAKFEPQPVPSPDAPHQRPTIVTGTFKVLVYTQQPLPPPPGRY